MAPIVAVEYTAEFLVEGSEVLVFSPYMSFAPQMTAQAVRKFAAVVHLDGSARVQTVDVMENRWLHELLMQVWELCGVPVLANMSLNMHGQPIVNSIRGALEISIL